MPSQPPEAWAPLMRFRRVAGRPLDHFLRIEAASGILLLLATAAALICANTSLAESYEALWHTEVGFQVSDFAFARSLEWVVNDGLMTIFFFVVGLEIRREIHKGELSQWRRAALPVAGAVGGMVAPALIYYSLARGPASSTGWGVPMATDIAFAVGILTLIGKRIPAALRVLLLALAVIDDLGAIVVIAAVYSKGLSWSGLVVAALSFLAIRALQRFGVRLRSVYVVPSVVAWAGVYSSGIHPTIAGVIVGMLTPIRAWFGPEGFVEVVRDEIKPLRRADTEDLSSHELAGTLREVDRARREAMSPAESLIELLHPWVAFGIMPVFAFANAGVALGGVEWQGGTAEVSFGVLAGLLLGKPLGVVLASWLVVKLGLAVLPLGLSMRHLTVLGVVAGVGFTMALFIAQLAFSDPALLSAAKLGILGASGVAASGAWLSGRLLLSTTHVPGCAQSADEAEQSTVA